MLRYWNLICSLICLSGSCLSQVMEPDLVNIKNLTKKLPLLSGREKVDCANELSKEYYYYSFWIGVDQKDSIKKYSGIAISESQKIGYNDGQVPALLNLGVVAARTIPLWNKEPAKKYFEEAISLAEVSKNYSLRAESYYLKALYLKFGTPEYRNLLEQSLYYNRLAGNKQGIAEAGLSMINYLNTKGKYDEALPYCEETLAAALLKRKKNILVGYIAIKDIFWELSRIHEAVGDYHSAIQYLHAARPYWKKLDGEWNLYSDIGKLFLRLKNFDSARYYVNLFQKATPGSPYGNMISAEIDLHTNRYKQALNSFLRIKDSVDINFYPVLNLNIAKSYKGLGDFKKAFRYARRWNGTIGKTLDDKLETYLIYSQLYDSLENHDSAMFII